MGTGASNPSFSRKIYRGGDTTISAVQEGASGGRGEAGAGTRTRPSSFFCVKDLLLFFPDLFFPSPFDVFPIQIYSHVY